MLRLVMICNTLAFLFALAAAILAYSVLASATAAPFDATLTNGFGSAPALDGTSGLLFTQHTNGPAIFIAIERRYRGMSLNGQISVRGVVTQSGTETVTLAMNKDAPTSIALTTTRCYLEYPIGSAANISGTIVYANYSPDLSGCCLYGGIDPSLCP